LARWVGGSSIWWPGGLTLRDGPRPPGRGPCGRLTPRSAVRVGRWPAAASRTVRPSWPISQSTSGAPGRSGPVLPPPGRWPARRRSAPRAGRCRRWRASMAPPRPAATAVALGAAQQAPLAGSDADQPGTDVAPSRVEPVGASQRGQERRRDEVRHVGWLPAPAFGVVQDARAVTAVEEVEGRRVAPQQAMSSASDSSVTSLINRQLRVRYPGICPPGVAVADATRSRSRLPHEPRNWSIASGPSASRSSTTRTTRPCGPARRTPWPPSSARSADTPPAPVTGAVARDDLQSLTLKRRYGRGVASWCR
jgi:hypothetical protein